MPPFQHFILTRFSVRASWAWQEFPREWLETRLDLFERFCLPTIAAQTDPAFRWLVYCDETTDEACLRRLRGYRADCPQLEVTITAVGPGKHPIRILDSFVDEATEVAITTRVDSDDGLNVDVVRVAHDYLEPFVESRHSEWLLNFPRGCKYDTATQSPYHTYLDNSPFHTLFERPHVRRPIRSVMSGNHSRLHQQYPTHQDHSLVGWLQVIYGGNVRNHINPLDIPADLSILGKLFAVEPGSPREYWTDLPPQVRPASPSPAPRAS